MKGDCHLKLEDYVGSLNDFKFYSLRKFKADDPNAQWLRYATFYYGRALLANENYEEAVHVFTKTLTLEKGLGKISDAEIHLFRGDSRKKAGKTGYLKDWQESLRQGLKIAKERIDNR